MQYPIIDLITSAYINNGWTGLDINTGVNLANLENSTLNEVYDENGNEIEAVYINYSFAHTDYIKVEPNTTYTLSITATAPTATNHRVIGWTNNKTYVRQETNLFLANNESYGYITFTTNHNVEFVTINYVYLVDDVIDIEQVQLQEGSEATPYEPYDPNPKNDFPNRLKLPLPHYFPHPVIDSLKRASEGTMTSKDREILTHYLTPLGIGGI